MKVKDQEAAKNVQNEFTWFYKGFKGWWQYDDRTSLEIETEYEKGTESFQLLIAGRMYTIDLKNNNQVRADGASTRIIKRDLRNNNDKNTPVKGVAGIQAKKKRTK